MWNDGALELRTPLLGLCCAKAAELAKINVELERSNNELDAFAYIASHDLKEPLQRIHNYSSFLIEDYADVLNVGSLETANHDAFDPADGRLDWVPAAFFSSGTGGPLNAEDLNEVVKNVIDVLSISLKDTKVDIRIPRTPVIKCDKVQVSECFSNLISNAINTTKSGQMGGNWLLDSTILRKSKY